MEIKIKNLEELNFNFLSELKNNILAGELIIYPTDTVYGLGAIITNEDSLKKIYEVKTRNFSSPLIALVDSVERITMIADIDEKKKDLLEKLAENFWPGALTIILNKKNNIPAIMVSGGNTVGVRIPNLKISQDIIKLAGGILATTSANISGQPSPKSYKELSKEIKERVKIIIDSGACEIGEASTIIDLTGNVPKILRKGAIEKKSIEKIIGKIEE